MQVFLVGCRRIIGCGHDPAEDPIGRLGGKFSVQDPQPPRVWISRAVCLFLVLAVWVVFGQTRHHDFVDYDDAIYIYENPVATNGVTWGGVVAVFTHAQQANWHPLTSLSNMLDCQLWGLDPGMHHLTSVLLHAATGVLLFLVLRKLTGAFWRCAFVAAVFAIHPLRVESVAWAAERKDVLSGLFFMLALWAYASHVQMREAGGAAKAGNQGAFAIFRSRPFWLALVWFALGLMSKPMLVTLPFVLLLLDYWPLQRFTAGDLWPKVALLFLEKIPFLLLAAADCLATILAQGNAVKTVQDVNLLPRIGNAMVAYVDYLWAMFYPSGLAVFYPHPGNHLQIWKAVLSLLALVLITAVVLAGRRKSPYLLVGWLWYLGMLVPVIGLMQVGLQARADRYTYLPQIGLYILVAWGAADLAPSWRHRRAVLGAAAAVILTGLTAAAYNQTGYWKNSIILWSHALACTQENTLVHDNLSFALAQQGRLDEAVRHYERALQLNPAFVEDYVNLGRVLAQQGKLDEAVQQYKLALQLDPHFALAEFNLGVARASQGKIDEAVQHYRQAIEINPGHVEAHINLGQAMTLLGKLDEAIQHYDRALQLQPGNAVAHFKLGEALDAQGRANEAVQHYQRALQLDPGYAEAHVNLGTALATEGRINDAIQQFERAIQIRPGFAEAHVNLGSALASQGKLVQGRAHLEQALGLATAQHDTALAESIRARLKALSPTP